jgi:hypothetical protein
MDAYAIRLAAKSGWGSPPFFDIPKWVFSGVTAETRFDSITLNCTNINRDIRGLCAGDVNGTYVPPYGIKQAEPSLQLIHDGQLKIAREITFPVTMETLPVTSSTLGAITLLLNYNPDLLDITGVEMPDYGDEPPYFVTSDGVLHIGWMSLNPITVKSKSTLMFIHARVKDQNADQIRITLNDNPLSELADGTGQILYGTKLTIADAVTLPVVPGSMLLSVYPNPAKDLINLEFQIEKEGTVRSVLMNLHGVEIVHPVEMVVTPGWNKAVIELRDIPNGAYLLKVFYGEEVRVIKVVVNR